MKVLTFGWEFPPHISGGLGTACYGLTKALQEENVSIIFVVPRVFGNEKMELVNASSIIIKEPLPTPARIRRTKKKTGRFEKLHVSSSLTPYSETGIWDKREKIKNWNYRLDTDKVPVERVKNKGIRYRFTGTYGPSLLNEVKRYGEVGGEIARQHNFDLIHAHDWLTFPAGIAAKKNSGKPLVVHVHATEYDRAGLKNMDHRIVAIEKNGFNAADLIMAVSNWTREILTEIYEIDPDKIVVVHNGIQEEDNSPFTAITRVSENIVTFLGRVTYQKGPKYFVQAAARVLEQFPETHFIIAGAGDLLPSTIDQIAQLKISSRVHCTGFLKGEKIKQIWSVSDVFVMPSVSEPFGIAPLEAIRAGVPVIVSNQSGVAEVLENVIKVDFWDSTALAEAIIQILQNKNLANSLRKESKKELEHLTWNIAARKIKNQYHEVCTTKP
ncbi:glycosyltransferase family 4 protein [Antarcticibacterium arcticum]|uniref:Glycosyltransferase family 4 protein n=1 Tax=Antarcticibacterium arcticum TaxID=2585771 RepID=A0A5B8YKR4_9FLAO|nr:glycosyltransferase family 4 protein [Antarcticibacterium arcticum]QED37223.1 glycosyltransferase family 4 protein [Antarcticibacterium arcticum]